MKRLLLWIVALYLLSLARLALLLARPNEIIGIAGSVGKSSTRLLLYEVIRDHYKTVMVLGNSETGIALSLLGIWPRDYSARDWLRMLIRAPFGIFHLMGTTHLIVEMGTDDVKPPKNMGFLLHLVRPTIAIHLNATATHTQQFSAGAPGGTIDEVLDVIAREDGKIMTQSGCRVAIYNSDDVHIQKVMTAAKSTSLQKILSFGKRADISLVSHAVQEDGTMFHLRTRKDQSIHIHIPAFLLPELYWENCAAVVLAARELGLSDEQIIEHISLRFTLPKSRGTVFAGVNDSLIIDSSYNNSRVPMQMYIQMAQQLARASNREFIVVMGDMRELGHQTAHEHEAVAQDLLASQPHAVYCVGDATKQYVVPRLPPDRTFSYRDSRTLGAYLHDHLPKHALVLVKGSQNTIFLEEVVVRILADPSDESRVCRMDPGWKKIKQRYFDTLTSL